MSEYIAKCNEVVGISGKPLIVPDYIDTSKEIVRCRDCKHKFMDTPGHPYCGRLGEYREFPTDDEMFCAWGRPKVVDE